MNPRALISENCGLCSCQRNVNTSVDEEKLCFTGAQGGGHDTNMTPPSTSSYWINRFLLMWFYQHTHEHKLSEWPLNSQQFKTTILMKIMSDAIKFRKK